MSLPDDLQKGTHLIDKAFDNGINFFDTADIYLEGRNEELIGKAIRQKRRQVVLASKAGNVRKKDGSGLDWNPSKQHILASIEGSLKRLKTDYIDLYQLHGGTIEDNIDETIEAFEQLKKEGKIRYYGISSIRPNVIRQYITRSNIVSVMMQYSLLDTRPEEDCLDLLEKNKIGVLVRGSLAQGLLVSKPPKNYLDHSTAEVKKAADAIAKISSPDRTASQTAIKYVLNHLAVTSAIVGIRTEEQLDESIRIINSPDLTTLELQSLNAINKITYKEHRD